MPETASGPELLQSRRMLNTFITLTPGEVSRYYAARVPHLKQRRATEWRGPCPIHHGKDDNFAVEPSSGLWFCHSSCGRGEDVFEKSTCP